MYFLYLAMLLSFTFNSIVAHTEATKPCGHRMDNNMTLEDKACLDKLFNTVEAKHDISDKLVDMVFAIHPEFNLITLSHEFAKRKNNEQLKFNAILLTGETGQGKTLAAEAIAKKLNANFSTVHISAFECWSDTDIEARLKKQSEQSNNSQTPHVIVIDGLGFEDRPFNECAVTRLSQFVDNCNDKNVTLIITTDSAKQLTLTLEAKFINFPLNKTHTIQNREKILQAFVKLKTENGALEHAVQNTSDMNLSFLKSVAKKATLNAHFREATEISQEDFDKAIKDIRD